MLVGHVGDGGVGEAVHTVWVARVVERAQVRDRGAVVVAERLELVARHLRHDIDARFAAPHLNQAAQLGDQIARDSVGQQLSARLVGDGRVEPARLALRVVLVDPDVLDVHRHRLPLAGVPVVVGLVGQPLAAVRQIHALADERDVEGEEERHLGDEHRAQLARQVQHQLVAREPVHKLPVHVVVDSIGVPAHAVVDEPLRRVVLEGAGARDAEAPGLAGRGERRRAEAALSRQLLAEADVLVGRVERHGVWPPVPGVFRRKVLKKVQLRRPVLTAQEGVVVLQQELTRRLGDEAIAPVEPRRRPVAVALGRLDGRLDPAVLEAAVEPRRHLWSMPCPLGNVRAPVGVPGTVPALHEHFLVFGRHVAPQPEPALGEQRDGVGSVHGRDVDVARVARHAVRDVLEDEDGLSARHILELV
mmetsp:Transcript_24199/g.78090  ORF Transcript_24199/g.78090 Transcript_24199/m.78090 type:complete len:418 (-) Transcript_24199:651-1904(-)